MVVRYRPFCEFTGDLKTARRRFRQRYGFAHDDKTKVDKQIIRLFEEASKELDCHDITIPAELVLALILREGFAREFNRPNREGSWDRLWGYFACEYAERKRLQYRRQGLSPRAARDKAVSEAMQNAPMVPEAYIRDNMSRAKHKSKRRLYEKKYLHRGFPPET